jgi:hypothetical protein
MGTNRFSRRFYQCKKKKILKTHENINLNTIHGVGQPKHDYYYFSGM